MKTKLLLFTLPLGLTAMNLSAQEYCEPENEWQPYAGISRVEINGMINVSGRTPKGGTCDFGEYYMGEPDKLVKLEPKGTYKMKIEFDNFNSGASDVYLVRAYFDWNCDGIFSKSETYQKEIVAGPMGGVVQVEMDIDVPEDAITGRLSRMRAFTSYKSNSPLYAGLEPCDLVEGGNFEDYDLKLNTLSSLNETELQTPIVGPNPATDVINFNCPEKVLEFGLYNLDGRLIDAGTVYDNFIRVSAYPAGSYLLKFRTESTIRQTIVLIK